MAKIRLVVAMGALVWTTACYHQETTVDTLFPEPTVVAGPPGGQMDPQWQEAAPGYNGYADPSGSPDGYATADGDPSGTYAVTGELEASADPQAPGYVMGEVTDEQIDQTLDGYGYWEETDEYGRVWRPSATVVGVDFTPYETCGSWVWTSDYGWVYGCDYDWGWLPFHYGRWGWIDDGWGWVPDYTWGPGWVDWRGGGGYVGWRPSQPLVRDHRGQHQGPKFHDHRTKQARQMDSQWRFATTEDFGKHNIRAHLFKNPAEGLRVTSIVTRPPLRGLVQPVHAASVMRGRLVSLGLANTSPGRSRPAFGHGSPSAGGFHGATINSTVTNDTPTWRQHAPASASFGGNDSAVWAPGASQGSFGNASGPARGGRALPQPSQGLEPDRTNGSFGGGAHSDSIPERTPESFGDPSVPEPTSTWTPPQHPLAPSQPTWTQQQPQQWSPPQHPMAPSQPTWTQQQPQQWSPPQHPMAPSHPTWTPQPQQHSPSTFTPSHSTFTPSSSSYSPSHSSGSYSAPSHSSSSSGGWGGGSHSSSASFGGGHSSGGFSGGGHSGGGFSGGHHR